MNFIILCRRSSQEIWYFIRTAVFICFKICYTGYISLWTMVWAPPVSTIPTVSDYWYPTLLITDNMVFLSACCLFVDVPASSSSNNTNKRKRRNRCHIGFRETKWLCLHAFVTILNKKTGLVRGYKRPVAAMNKELKHPQMLVISSQLAPVVQLSRSKFVTEVIWWRMC